MKWIELFVLSRARAKESAVVLTKNFQDTDLQGELSITIVLYSLVLETILQRSIYVTWLWPQVIMT